MTNGAAATGGRTGSANEIHRRPAAARRFAVVAGRTSLGFFEPPASGRGSAPPAF